jgi:peptide/nickel transport system permease protein
MSTEQSRGVEQVPQPLNTERILLAETKAVAARTPAWKTLLRDPQAVITASILIIIFGLGTLASVLGQDPNAATLSQVNAPSGTPGYPLGGDESGRDIWSRLLHSINTSAISALIATSVALVLGVAAGLIGGYFGRRLRSATEWIFTLVMTFPGLLLLIILMPLTGGDYRWTMLIFGVLLSPGIYRVVRNLVLGVKHELYVDAARVSGLGNTRILTRHVLSVIRGPIIIATAFMAGSAIGLQSGLAFLGVGSKETPSFGSMIASGFNNLYLAPLQFLWPSLALGLITASLVLLGNSLRDALEGSRPQAARVGAGLRAASELRHVQTESDVPDLLEIRDLTIAYPAPEGGLREVVQGLSLSVTAGQTLGLVGESGSGKTQTAFSILGVLPNEAVVTAGSIRLEGRELVGLTDAQMRGIRGKIVSYIPQEPMSNLDPSFTVGAQLVEGLRAVSDLSRKDAKARVIALLQRCGIPDPEGTFTSYPHQISGGMAQRVLIAGAVASRPKLLIADEPTTALDVTVQAEILDLLRELQAELGMAVLLVTHNFGVVADSCEQMAVMRRGQIVETGSTLDIFDNPAHEYTSELLDSILDEDSIRIDPPALAGENQTVTRS